MFKKTVFRLFLSLQVLATFCNLVLDLLQMLLTSTIKINTMLHSVVYVSCHCASLWGGSL